MTELNAISEEKYGKLKLWLARLVVCAGFCVLLWFLAAPPIGLRIKRRHIEGAILIYSSVSSGIIGIQMRRKVSRSLGRKATAADLTSLKTWIDVEEVEEQKRKNHPL
jgi:hypothetical protein